MVFHLKYPEIAVVDVRGKFNLQVLIALAAGDWRYDSLGGVRVAELTCPAVLDDRSTVFFGDTPVVVEEMHPRLSSAGVQELCMSLCGGSEGFMQANILKDILLTRGREGRARVTPGRTAPVYWRTLNMKAAASVKEDMINSK